MRKSISNTLLAACFIACAIIGGMVGASIREAQLITEIEDAWDDVTVVADGTLVANPSYYAWHPDQMGEARSVRVISNRQAAIDLSSKAVIETALN